MSTSNVEDRIRRALENAAEPPTQAPRLADLRSARARRLLLRRIRVVLLSILVVVGSVGGTAALTQWFEGRGQTSKELDSRVPAEVFPGQDVVIGMGALWVLTCDRCSDRQVTGGTAVGRLLKIDPRDGRVLRVASVANPGMVAAGTGAVWVTNVWANTVTRVDPRSLAVNDVIHLRLPFAVAPGDRRFVPLDVAVGEGAVWVGTDRGVVARIDARTDAVTHLTTLPSKVGGYLATGGGAIWIGDELAGIYRMDPISGRILGRTSISRGRLRMSVGEVIVASRAVWAIGDWARPQPDFDRTDYVATNRWGLVRLDPQTGAVTDMVSIRSQSALVTGPGGAWVVHGGTSLQQFRREGGGLRVLTTSLDGAGFLSFDGRALLVLRSDGTVHRMAFRDLFESPASVRPAGYGWAGVLHS